MAATYEHRPDRKKSPHRVVIWRDGVRSRRSFETKDEALEVIEALNAQHESLDEWLSGGPMPIDRTIQGWFETYQPTMARSTRATTESLLPHPSPSRVFR